ncbi:MAG: glutamate synthase central domain-containing protein, partial [Flavobacteriaceae bacterium]|nr:glutamate synthase central domain-containing protein [Flavobacteriaceae bacterium]
VFLPKKENQKIFCKEVFLENIQKFDLELLGWRKVPVDSQNIGRIASESEPDIEQIFIGKGQSKLNEYEFMVKLYIVRKLTENTIRESKLSESSYFYLPTLSTKTIIFKGLLKPKDIKLYYTDLMHPDVITRLALVHQRFSTNTFPTWDLAQPFRYMCHNGEINTLRGNVSRMKAREELLKSDLFGEEIKKILPIIIEGKSDSACMDNVVELLLMTGRSLPEVMMMLIPEAWEKHKEMSPEKKAFYEFNSCLMEPWDGPASIPFTDGNYIGALLDRNGLRPSRYTVTKDGYVIMSSETGVVDIEPKNIESHGRLEPGRMFLVDMNAGRIINDDEIKNRIVSQRPYQQWIDKNLVHLRNIPYINCPIFQETESIDVRKRIFGYTVEDVNTIINPMAILGKEAIGSMGTDTPLAVLSDRPQLTYNYFKQ